MYHVIVTEADEEEYEALGENFNPFYLRKVFFLTGIPFWTSHNIDYGVLKVSIYQSSFLKKKIFSNK